MSYSNTCACAFSQGGDSWPTPQCWCRTAFQSTRQIAVSDSQSSAHGGPCVHRHIIIIIAHVLCTILVTRNFTKSADCPRRKSAVFPRHRRGYPRNRVRVSAESCMGVRRIVKGCPQNRDRVSAEL